MLVEGGVYLTVILIDSVVVVEVEVFSVDKGTIVMLLKCLIKNATVNKRGNIERGRLFNLHCMLFD